MMLRGVWPFWRLPEKAQSYSCVGTNFLSYCFITHYSTCHPSTNGTLRYHHRDRAAPPPAFVKLKRKARRPPRPRSDIMLLSQSASSLPRVMVYQPFACPTSTSQTVGLHRYTPVQKTRRHEAAPGGTHSGTQDRVPKGSHHQAREGEPAPRLLS